MYIFFVVAALSSLSHSRSNSPLPYARRRRVDLLEFLKMCTEAMHEEVSMSEDASGHGLFGCSSGKVFFDSEHL